MRFPSDMKAVKVVPQRPATTSWRQQINHLHDQLSVCWAHEKTFCPGLAEALSHLRAGDSLVFWRLGRLGRSLPHLATIAQLQARGSAAARRWTNRRVATTWAGAEHSTCRSEPQSILQGLGGAGRDGPQVRGPILTLPRPLGMCPGPGWCGLGGPRRWMRSRRGVWMSWAARGAPKGFVL